jgi:YggT family protein
MSPETRDVATLVLRVVDVAAMLYLIALLGRALVSWFEATPHHPAARFVIRVTEPPRRVLLRLLPRALREFPVDLAFLLLFVLVLMIQVGAEEGLAALRR